LNDEEKKEKVNPCCIAWPGFIGRSSIPSYESWPGGF